MYFLGYSQATHTLRPDVFLFCGDPTSHLTEEEQVGRAQAVDMKAAEANEMGCHGMSPLIGILKYMRYTDSFVVPIAHAGLHGAVRDFWVYVFNNQDTCLTAGAKAVIQQRASDITATCDYGRTYTDIVCKKGNWVMEDWLHWTESWSVYILSPVVLEDGRCQPLLQQHVADMWQHLRSGILYFVRVNPLPDVAQTGADAQKHLKDYADMVEQKFGPKQCKFNLHLLICRLLAQEAVRGKVAYSTEYWIETLIQWAKSSIRYRTTKYPELVLVHDMLADECLARVAAQYPGLARFDTYLPVDRYSSRGLSRGSNLDSGGDDGTQLLGTGTALCSGEVVVVKAAVAQRIAHNLLPGWDIQKLAQASFTRYTYADIRGEELLHSISYPWARTRISYHVLSKYYEGERTTESRYIAKVLYFVMMSAPGMQPIRLAISDLFEVRKQPGAVGTLWCAPSYDRPSFKNYAVGFDASEMLDKHVIAERKNDPAAWFMPYSNMSGSNRS